MNNVDPGKVVLAIVFLVFFGFGLALVASMFTIISLNVLFVKELIPLTFESVLSLAWLKFAVGGLLSGIVRINQGTKA